MRTGTELLLRLPMLVQQLPLLWKPVPLQKAPTCLLVLPETSDLLMTVPVKFATNQLMVGGAPLPSNTYMYTGCLDTDLSTALVAWWENRKPDECCQPRKELNFT